MRQVYLALLALSLSFLACGKPGLTEGLQGSWGFVEMEDCGQTRTAKDFGFYEVHFEGGKMTTVTRPNPSCTILTTQTVTFPKPGVIKAESASTTAIRDETACGAYLQSKEGLTGSALTSRLSLLKLTTSWIDVENSYSIENEILTISGPERACIDKSRSSTLTKYRRI